MEDRGLCIVTKQKSLGNFDGNHYSIDFHYVFKLHSSTDIYRETLLKEIEPE